MRPETRYARSGDVHVAFQVHGSGPLDLVVVPGFVSNVDQVWEMPGSARLLSRLGAFARVIHFDKRGTGLSDRLAGIASLEQRMDDLRAVMDAAGSDRAVVFGSSEGGGMSALFAAAHPARVRALVLYGAYASYSAHVLSGARLGRYLADIEAGWGSGVTLRWLAPRWADRPDIRAAWARLEQHGASPHAALQVVAMNARIDVREVLPTIRVPTLVLHRKDDLRVPFAAGRFLAEHIPGARLVSLEGDAHPPGLGDVDAIADEIEAFVTGVRPHPPAPAEARLAAILATEPGSAGLTGSAASLEPYRAAVEETLTRFGGRALGPAVSPEAASLAAFDGPARAVRAAAALAAAAEALLGVRLKAGVHVGEIDAAEEDATAGGLALRVARAIARHARAGEILVSSTVRDLVPGAGLRLRERELRLPLTETGGARLTLLAYAGDDRESAAPAGAGKGGQELTELSPREREVLRRVAAGLSNPAIAAALGLSEHTVKRHVANILLKLALPTRAAAAALAARAGLV
jgi:pimeloyl-ACP methyl ester carboxylesterase/DNA-binding CsgD family transcriptional regulator